METFKCDICEADVPVSERLEVRTPRPSDPTDMCCILWVGPCHPSGGKTAAEWNVWIENEGREKGFMWLS